MKQTLTIAVFVVFLGVILFMFREPILLTIGDFLIVQDELKPADAIHVISGPDNTRIDYALRLYQQGYAKQLIFTGGWCDCTNANSADYARRRALQQGVPPEAITTDGTEVTSTYAEIIQMKTAISHNTPPLHSLIGISDPFHMWRSRWTYRQVLDGQIKVQMAPVPFENSPYQRRWWTDEASRQDVKEEYLKILYYYARYKFGWGPIGEWLATFDRD